MPRNYTKQCKIDVSFDWLNNTDKNKAKYDALCKQPLSDISNDANLLFPPMFRLIRTEIDGDNFRIALLSDVANEVLYYLNCKIINDVCFNRILTLQVMVWKPTDVSFKRIISRTTERVFAYLLEQYNIAAPNGCQIREGRDFWVRKFGYALERGLYVYRYDQKNHKLTRITDHSTIRDNSCDLWGDTARYEKIYALISKNELKI